MKVLIIGGQSSRNAGGIFHIVHRLGYAINDMPNSDVHFLMYDDEYSLEDRKYYQPLPLHVYKVLGPLKLGFSMDMYKKLNEINPDVVHLHGIWNYFSSVNRKYNRKTNTPYVISPHGMLDPWQLNQSLAKNLKK